MSDLSKVTRVEVIDGYGRSYMSHNADQTHISVQDEGRTLKIFHTGDTSHGITEEHAESLGELMALDLESWSGLSRKIAAESFEAQAEVVKDDS